jgi:hypothetical protein
VTITRKGDEGKDKLIAFQHSELDDWLIGHIEDGSENFLCALAEVAEMAEPEDYGTICLALI